MNSKPSKLRRFAISQPVVDVEQNCADIRVLGSVAFLSLSRPGILDKALRSRYRHFSPDGKGNLRWDWCYELHYERYEPENLPVELGTSEVHAVWRTAASLVPRLVLALKKAGYQTEVTDLSNRPVLRRASRGTYDDAVDLCGDVQLVNALTDNMRGQLLVHDAAQAALVVATIVMLYPRLAPIIITATLDEATQLDHHLSSRLPHNWEVQHTHKGALRAGTLPIITMQLANGNVLRDHKLLIIWGWGAVCAKLTRETAGTHQRRQFALLSGKPPQLSKREKMRLLATAGPVVYDGRTVSRVQQ